MFFLLFFWCHNMCYSFKKKLIILKILLIVFYGPLENHIQQLSSKSKSKIFWPTNGLNYQKDPDPGCPSECKLNCAQFCNMTFIGKNRLFTWISDPLFWVKLLLYWLNRHFLIVHSKKIYYEVNSFLVGKWRTSATVSSKHLLFAIKYHMK